MWKSLRSLPSTSYYVEINNKQPTEKPITLTCFLRLTILTGAEQELKTSWTGKNSASEHHPHI